MALSDVGRLWKLARRVEELFELQAKVRESFEVIDDRLKNLENRMIQMEAERRELVTEAKSAATAAATTIAGGILSDVVTRITRLEERAGRQSPSEVKVDAEQRRIKEDR